MSTALTYKTGDTVAARNPQTSQVEQGTIVKFTKNGWIHIEFSTGIYRFTPDEVVA